MLAYVQNETSEISRTQRKFPGYMLFICISNLLSVQVINLNNCSWFDLLEITSLNLPRNKQTVNAE